MFSEKEGSGRIPVLFFKKAGPFKSYTIGSVIIPYTYMLYIFLLENHFSLIIQNEFEV